VACVPRALVSFFSIGVVLGVVCAPRDGVAQQLLSEIFVESEILGIPKTIPLLQGTAGPLQDSFDFLDGDLILPDGFASISTHVDFGIFQLRASLAIDADALGGYGRPAVCGAA